MKTIYFNLPLYLVDIVRCPDILPSRYFENNLTVEKHFLLPRTLKGVYAAYFFHHNVNSVLKGILCSEHGNVTVFRHKGPDPQWYLGA